VVRRRRRRKVRKVRRGDGIVHGPGKACSRVVFRSPVEIYLFI
jgi:hypothetical protein